MSERMTRRTFTKTTAAATLGLTTAQTTRVLGANELLHYEYRKPWKLG